MKLNSSDPNWAGFQFFCKVLPRLLDMDLKEKVTFKALSVTLRR